MIELAKVMYIMYNCLKVEMYWSWAVELNISICPIIYIECLAYYFMSFNINKNMLIYIFFLFFYLR